MRTPVPPPLLAAMLETARLRALTPEGFRTFNAAQFESQHAAHTAAAQARARAAVLWLASASDPVPLTDAEREEIDMAVYNWKASGGPVRDHEARAVAIEGGFRGTPYGSQP